jgi:hypothetical protein
MMCYDEYEKTDRRGTVGRWAREPLIIRLLKPNPNMCMSSLHALGARQSSTERLCKRISHAERLRVFVSMLKKTERKTEFCVRSVTKKKNPFAVWCFVTVEFYVHSRRIATDGHRVIHVWKSFSNAPKTKDFRIDHMPRWRSGNRGARDDHSNRGRLPEG